MASSDNVKTLLLQVDASVALAQRNMAALARTVDQSSADMNRALDSTVKHNEALGKSFGNTRVAQMELQHVVKSSIDSLAAGASPLRILSLELGRVTEAVSFMGGGGGALGKLGAFLGGPWGLAVQAGVGLLTIFGAKLFDSGEDAKSAAEKLAEHRKKVDEDAAAQAAYERTADGAADALKKTTEELDKQNRSLEENIALTKQKITSDLQTVRQGIGSTSAQLTQAQADLRETARTYDARRSGVGLDPSSDPGAQVIAAGAAYEAARQRVSDLTGELAKLQGAATAGNRALVEVDFPLLERNAQAAVDPIQAINIRFDAMRHSAESAALGNKRLQASLQGTLILIEKNREKALDLAKAQEKTPRGNGYSDRQSGRQVSFAEATSIAKAAGFSVNSGYRSVADQARLYNDPSVNRPGNPVAAPGSSAHNGLNGRWALDIQIGPGVTPGNLRKVFGDQGVTLTKVLKEAGHYHIEGSQSEAAGALRQAVADARRTNHVDDRFQDELSRLDKQLAEGRAKLVTGTQERADAEKAAIDQETQAYAANVDRDQDLSALQKRQLVAERTKLATQQKANVDEQAQAQIAQEQLGYQRQVSEGELTHLQHLLRMTPLRAEQLDLQLQIIDATTQQLISEQQAVIDSKTASDAQKDIARLRIQQLREQQQDQHTEAARSNASPMQQYLQQLQDAGANIDDKFQEIQARGLDALNTGLVDAITGTRKLGDVFKDVSRQIISEILQIVIQQQLIKPIAQLLGGGSGGSSSGFLGSILGALGSGGRSFSVDSSSAFASLNAGNSGFISGLAGARADGGPMQAGKPYLVGERGEEIVVPNTNSTVIPNHKIGGGGRGGALTVHVTSDDDKFHAFVVNGAGQVFAQNAPRLAGATKASTLRDASRPRIMG